MVGRLGLTDIAPVVSGGAHPAKAVVGEAVPVSATVFREGHDAIAASVALAAPDGRRLPLLRMTPGEPGTDRFHATLVPDAPGLWTFTVTAWSDPMSTWRHAVTVKIDAGQSAADLDNDLELGARLFDRLAHALPKADRQLATDAAQALRDQAADLAHRVGPALDPYLQRLAHDHPVRELITRSRRFDLWVDRPRALFGAWYEFFPRSIGALLADDPHTPARPTRHGTLADATAHLDYVADLGFDVVYLPPIHPIGEVNRKGPNNTLVAADWDVGSPWAIGSAAGGHDAIHPPLGTMADFRALVRRANKLGLEVALDFALQCAPDHPWVSAHPEWFTTRPDGAIAYAENPPKKYQDIYPLNFDNDPVGLYAACRAVLEVWINAGVKIFRVDNPHTKPLNFWHWLIAEVKKSHPEVLFLAEAFTRPAMMHELARIGFSQSYTYFTWRNGKDELQDYVNELISAAHYMRPNFFVNTPDILHEFLQHGGPGGFRIRAVLAAMLAPSWGVYSGFELFENQPIHPGSEEYLDSEKYQLRPRDFAAAEAEGRSLAPLLRRLNQIRHDHPALRWLRNTRFHWVDNDAITAFSKRDPESGDTVVVVCSTDPHSVREGWVDLDLPALGLDWPDRFIAHDLLTDARYEWGQHNFVRLDPHRTPAHVLAVEPLSW
ncbi:MAG: alpha-1,4-glucan--maltose-1-phosphate maltosyltransferase [Actinomycetia bacterium]|nr:alpha-1,4-glucan--maltose-1-phosphate maltosyltransferase [Actinomycetes bacterium]